MKYVLYIAKLYSLGIFKPIVKALEEIKIEYGFYVSDNVKRNWLSEWDQTKILHSLQDAIHFNADVVLCPGNFVDWRIPGLKVQIFHGLGVEKPAHFKIRHFFDVYVTSGPYVTQKFKALQKKYHNYFEVIETGWPKVDDIINYDSSNLRTRLNIPNDKQVILYAPTFSNTMESASKTLSSIKDLVANDEIWLLKFHQLMNKSIVEEFKKMDSEKIRVMEINDITPLLYVSDIMISDTSSVIYEFMILNKPVITINTLDLKDKGINVTSVHELRPAINLLKQNPDYLRNNIEKYISLINPYNDGKICFNLINQLEKIVALGTLPHKNKPKNLFRKGQILYHSIIKKGYLR